MAELTRKELLIAVISGRGAAYLRGLDLSALDLGGVGWLFDADLREANLAHANLSRANLRGARLENANLHAANLSGANLCGADLRRTNLVVANLRLANLNGANLHGANLVGASLANANLEGANMDGADLEGANLEGANLRKANFGSANLRKVNLQDAILDATGLAGSLPDKGTNTDRAFLSSVGFSGSIGSIHLMDLIQLVCLSRSSLVLRLESLNGKGSVHICKGEIRHAETEILTGEDAFSDMMRWKGGRFETVALPEDAPVSISMPLEHLLVESMRRYDETTTPGQEEMAALLLEIRRHVPLGIAPSQEVLDLMLKAGKHFDSSEDLNIVDTFFSSANGEILCSISAGESVFTAPLKLVELRCGEHLLSERIAAYRRERRRLEPAHLPGAGAG